MIASFIAKFASNKLNHFKVSAVRSVENIHYQFYMIFGSNNGWNQPRLQWEGIDYPTQLENEGTRDFESVFQNIFGPLWFAVPKTKVNAYICLH